MALFLHLLTNLIPLYMIIAAGYAAGRWLHVDRQALGNLVLYIFMPVVMFGFVVDLDLKAQYALLPVMAYALFAVPSLVFLYLGRKIYGDARANLLSMCAGMGNTGYFGLPLVLLFFEKHWVALYMFMLLGGVFFEATIGYYIAARGKYSVRESLIKLSRFPSLYAVSAALVLNFAHVQMPGLFTTYWTHFKGAYVITGMMIIGAALGKMQRLTLSPRFIALAFLGKFMFAPLVAVALILLDIHVLHLYGPELHKLLYILAIVPPAANIAAFAAQMDLRPEKAAATVLVGTLLALVYIPVMLSLWALAGP